MSRPSDMDDSFHRVTVALLRPKSPGNVGSVARAMKNTGFGRLVLADPIRFDDPAYFAAEAGRMAWQAADLLESRLETPDLPAALAGHGFVLGTSSRPAHGARVLSPREAAGEVALRLARQPALRAALLFGQEDIGLTLEDMSRCHALVTIPSAEAYPSLNLAQAALILLYELRLALLAEPPGAAPQTVDQDLPTHEELEAFYGRLEQALDGVGFLQGSGRRHMMIDLRAYFNRSLLAGRELSIFEGIVRQMLWAARRRG